MFTDRYVKVPVNLYNTEQADMVGYTDETKEGETEMRLDPFQVSHYRPAMGDNDEKMTNILIHMKNADSFYSYISVEEFEKILNGVT